MVDDMVRRSERSVRVSRWVLAFSLTAFTVASVAASAVVWAGVASAQPIESPLDGRSPNGGLISGELRGVINNLIDTYWWVALACCAVMCIYGSWKVGVNRKSGMAQSAFEGTGVLWSAAGATLLVAAAPLWFDQILDIASGA